MRSTFEGVARDIEQSKHSGLNWDPHMHFSKMKFFFFRSRPCANVNRGARWCERPSSMRKLFHYCRDSISNFTLALHMCSCHNLCATKNALWRALFCFPSSFCICTSSPVIMTLLCTHSHSCLITRESIFHTVNGIHQQRTTGRENQSWCPSWERKHALFISVIHWTFSASFCPRRRKDAEIMCN